MSLIIGPSSKFWFGRLPERAKKLLPGWEYIEDPKNFLKVRSPDGSLFWIHPRTGVLTRCA